MEIRLIRLFRGGLSLGGVVVMVFLLGFEGYTYAIVHGQSRTSLPENYGNFKRIRNSLEKQGPKEKFSFAVVSDMAETCSFERLCNKLRDEGLSFMMMLGGFVLTCEKSSYDYFKYAYTHQYHLPFPVFLVVGDHDIVYNEVNFDIGNVSLADFENMYGPLNFFFEYDGCLFIGLCILPPPYSTRESMEFLDSTLAMYAERNHKIFVFTHRLPIVSAFSKEDHSEEMQTFEDIVSRYKVDYVVTVNNDGYAREEKEGTTYLTSVLGKGDVHLKDERILRDLCHALVFTVTHDSVSEKFVFVRHCVEASARHFAMTRLFPFLKRHPATTIVENLLVLGMLCVFLRNLIREKP